MSYKLKLLIVILILIIIIIPAGLLGYGAWSLNHSKKELNEKKSKAFLSTGITTIIIGSIILFIELLFLIVIILYNIGHKYNII